MLPYLTYESIKMQCENIKQLIEAGLPNSQAVVEGDGTHFSAIVICPDFAGLSRIRRQQLVYKTVHNQLHDGSLHALSLKTLTPAEWNQQAEAHGA